MQTVRYAGYTGLKNGKLLAAAEKGKFGVLVTIDKSIKYQNNFTGRTISILVVRTVSSDLSDLLPHLSAIIDALRQISPGQVIYVGHGITLDEAQRSQRKKAL